MLRLNRARAALKHNGTMPSRRCPRSYSASVSIACP
jgi:hypothetical protein